MSKATGQTKLGFDQAPPPYPGEAGFTNVPLGQGAVPTAPTNPGVAVAGDSAWYSSHPGYPPAQPGYPSQHPQQPGFYNPNPGYPPQSAQPVTVNVDCATAHHRIARRRRIAAGVGSTIFLVVFLIIFIRFVVIGLWVWR